MGGCAQQVRDPFPPSAQQQQGGEQQQGAGAACLVLIADHDGLRHHLLLHAGVHALVLRGCGGLASKGGAHRFCDWGRGVAHCMCVCARVCARVCVCARACVCLLGMCMHLAAQVPAACGRCAGKPDAPDKQLRTHR